MEGKDLDKKVFGMEDGVRDEDNFAWEGHDVKTPQIDLAQDPGVGKETIIRMFEIALPPRKKNDPAITNEEIIKHHEGVIYRMLWSDGWEPDGNIRCVRKRTKVILLIPAKPGYKGGMMQSVLEKPVTLSQLANGKARRNTK